MSPRFQFIGFKPTIELQEDAESMLECFTGFKYESSAVAAVLEKTEAGFRCAIELNTSYGPIVAESYRKTPTESLMNVHKKLVDKLERRYTTESQKNIKKIEIRNVQTM